MNILTLNVASHAVQPNTNNTNKIANITIIGTTEYLLALLSPANKSSVSIAFSSSFLILVLLAL